MMRISLAIVAATILLFFSGQVFADWPIIYINH